MSRASKRMTRMDPAFVIVDKPPGVTSHGVVTQVRRIYGERRVGHSGTLDPDATGVLVVGIGVANRLFGHMPDQKEYEATVRFGSTTSTLDASGDVIDTFAMDVTREDLDRVIPQFIGEVGQIPPMVSALKVDGVRLHELARAGTVVERASRPVRIDSIAVRQFRPRSSDADEAEVDLIVRCGGGTYIRTLAADLGTALGGGAHLRTLRRTQVGTFRAEAAHTLAAIAAHPEAAVLPIAAAFSWSATDLANDDPLTQRIRNGARFPAELGEGWSTSAPIVVSIAGRVAAVYACVDDEWRPVVGVPQLQD